MDMEDHFAQLRNCADLLRWLGAAEANEVSSNTVPGPLKENAMDFIGTALERVTKDLVHAHGKAVQVAGDSR
jgi:hypothetical protein